MQINTLSVAVVTHPHLNNNSMEDKKCHVEKLKLSYVLFQIVRLMSVSCGGIIGLTTAALIIMGLSFFIGLLSSRKNRIEPIVENRRASSIIHRPPYE